MFNVLMVTSAATRLSVTITVGIVFAACNGRENVQCQQNTNCDLSSTGRCVATTTGNSWCAYPDPGCSSGYRYSHDDVGDGVSGACVAAVDAGVAVDTGVPVGSSPPFASCMALAHTCGPQRDGDCCESLIVSGGTYFRSYDLAGDAQSGDMNYPATVSNFYLDKYEVTVGRFRAFIEDGQGTQAKHPAAGAGAHAKIPGSGWQASWNTDLPVGTAELVVGLKCDPEPFVMQTWTDEPGVNENRPINCITWYEAMAFCVWDGGRLPTEAEWNYAAAGAEQQRAYAWSNPGSLTTIDSAHASVDCLGDGVPSCTLADLVPVGTKPLGDGLWGQSDLTGNVSEWTLDWSAPYESTCADCANLSVASKRVLRGGSFLDFPKGARTGVRAGSQVPTAGSLVRGIRCARDVP